MASYRGAATISAIGVPPTGSAPEVYHRPLESWLKAFEIDTGKQKIKPYDPTVGKQIADMLRPSLKDQIPSDPTKSPSRSASAGGSPTRRPPPELLERAGFTKKGDKWFMPDGKPFTITLMVEGDAASGDDPRRHHDRPAMAPVRHRRHDGGGAGQHGRPPRRRRLRGDDQLERRDLGRPSRPRRTSSTAGIRSSSRRPASRSRRATGSAGAIPNSTRSSSRSARSASTIPRASSSAANTSSSPCARCRRFR